MGLDSLSSIHSYCHLKRFCSALLAILWFDGLRLYGASPNGLGRGNGGFVGFGAVDYCLVVRSRGLEQGFPPLINPRHFADLRGLDLLLLGEELMSGLEHLSPLLRLESKGTNLKSANSPNTEDKD